MPIEKETEQRKFDAAENKEDRLAMEAVQELCKFGIDNFKKLDKNNDGFLTKDELKEAYKSKKYQGDEGRFVRTMMNKVDIIQTAWNDSWGYYDTRGISYRDLSHIKEWSEYRIQAVEDARAFRETIGRNFAKIDTDNSKSISRDELETAATNAFKFSRYDRLNFQSALKNFGLICSYDRYFSLSTSIKPEDLTNRVKIAESKTTGGPFRQIPRAVAEDLRKR